MNKLHILLLGAYMSCLGQNLMAAATAEPEQKIQGRFLTTTEDKQSVADYYRETYFQKNDARQYIVENIDTRSYNYVTQKIIGLNIFKNITISKNLYILPIGIKFTTPVSIQTLTGDTALRYQLDLEGVKPKQISRFAGAIVYDRNTGGMAYIDVNRQGSHVCHFPDELTPTADNPSSRLAEALITDTAEAALADMKINMHMKKVLTIAGDTPLTDTDLARKLSDTTQSSVDLTRTQQKLATQQSLVPLLTTNKSFAIFPLSATAHPYTIVLHISENAELLTQIQNVQSARELDELVARLRGIKITINPSAIGLEFDEAIRAAQPAAAEDAATPLLPGREPSFEDAGGAADSE